MKFGCQPAKRESMDKVITAAVHTTDTMEKTRIFAELKEVKMGVKMCSERKT